MYILRWVVEDEEKMVAEAKRRGMEEPGGQATGAPVSGSFNERTTAAMAQNLKPRALVRTDTDEEHERLNKQMETWKNESAIGRSRDGQ